MFRGGGARQRLSGIKEIEGGVKSMDLPAKTYFENGADLPDELIDDLLRKAHSRLAPALGRIRRPLAQIASVQSSLGPLVAAQSAHGLLALRFMDSGDSAQIVAALKDRFELVEDQTLAAQVAGEIDGLMRGQTDAISHRLIDLSLVESEFQRRALKRLRQVPPGSVVTYQGLAAAVGAPSAQRAVGNTVASNPVPIYVPCHRVIRSDGSLGNYGGGRERKLKLLQAEGFLVDSKRRVSADAVYGHWTSRIFCRPSCAAVRRADRKKWVIFVNAQRARSFGMRPCRLCRPT
jgi:O-6-methylguanine DNA methyltransferase